MIMGPCGGKTEIEVATDNDNVDEDHGSMSVTLNAPTTADDYTVAGSASENSQTLNVRDNDTPVIEISSAPNTEPGDPVRVNLIASILPWQSKQTAPNNKVAIRFTPTESTTSFLTPANVSGTTYSKDVIFEEGDDNVVRGSFEFATELDDPNTVGTIDVALAMDSNTADPKYEVTTDVNKNSVEVSITTAPKPTLEIIAHTDRAIEGSGNTAKFIVTADRQPENNTLNVDITITETPAAGNITYIAASENLVNNTKSITDHTLNFVAVTSTGPNPTTRWEAPFSVALRATDSADEPHGTVTVALEAAAFSDNFVVATGADSSAEQTIYDLEVPEISIVAVPSTVTGNEGKILGGDDATFTLSSDIEPHEDINVRFTATNGPTGPSADPGDFLDPADPVSGTTKNSGDERLTADLSFATDGAATPKFEETLTISTLDNRNKATGDIIVALVDHTATNTEEKTYTLANANTSATVSVLQRPKPELSIPDLTSPVNEGDMATFRIIANENPRRPISVNFGVANTRLSFLGDPTSPATSYSPQTLNFTADQNHATNYFAEIVINTANNDVDSDSGEITVTLMEPSTENANDYTIANDPTDDPDHTGKVTIHDNDAPEISIADASLTLVGSDASFTLSTMLEPWEPISIRFIPRETTTNFLDPTGGGR